MPATATPNPVDTVNGPETSDQVKRIRKPRRLDKDGKPMRRMVLLVSDVDRGRILTAIVARTGALFVRAYGGDKITASGDTEEYHGRTLATICDDWMASIEEEILK